MAGADRSLPCSGPREYAQATRVDRKAFVKTEFSAEVGDQVFLVQPVRAASRQTKTMVGVVGRQYTVEIADECLVVGGIEQSLFVDPF